MKTFSVAVLFGFLLLLSGCCAMQHGGPGHQCANCPAKQQGAVAGVAAPDTIYVCNCGPSCKCNSVSKSPGKCACGSPLKMGHVIKIEGDEALVCMCKEGCTCKIDPKDPSKCGCGQPVKRVSLKGSGLYFCNCGSSCTCNTVSDKPGTCKCNMPLKKVD